MENNDEHVVNNERSKIKQKDWLTGISIISLILAIIMLIAMTNFPSFFLTGIILGFVGATLDFVWSTRASAAGSGVIPATSFY